MVITLNSIKGGVGKSTLATTLAIWLSKKNFDVLLVDGDDQETTSEFTAWRAQTKEGDIGYTLANYTGVHLRAQVLALKNKFDYIVIDTGGRDTTSQRAALSISDISMIPFAPRSFDSWTIDKMVDVLNEIQAIRADSPLRVVTFLNRADVRSADNRDMAKLLSEVEEFEYIPCAIISRKAVSTSAGQGLSVFDLPQEERDLKAEKEFDDLFSYILKV